MKSRPEYRSPQSYPIVGGSNLGELFVKWLPSGGMLQYDLKLVIFGRETEAPHSHLGKLALDWTESTEPSLRAIGWNLFCDHRVSEARAAHFYEYTGRPASPAALERALIQYYDECVCKRSAETYYSHELNLHNFVPRSTLRRDLSLVHVMNVSRWVRDLSDDSLNEGMKDLTDPKNISTPDQIRDFLGKLFLAINSKRDERPIWVGRWKAFEKHLTPEADLWTSAVGVYARKSTWRIVLRYPASNVRQLVRPTQLDAGYNQYHFPSPPFPHSAIGGFAMALRELAGSPPLLSEWIHRPIDWDTSFWVPEMWASVLQDTANSLGVFRVQHRERLITRFPNECTKWIPPG
jgi:hypothetical protein